MTDKDGGPADKHIYDFPFKLGLPAGEDHSDNRLNLRAYIATAALQGLLANPAVSANTNEDGKQVWPLDECGDGGTDEALASTAIKLADALITELAKERT